MAAQLIKNIRRGQAELGDQMLVELVTRSGAVTVDDLSRVIEHCEPGRVGEQLVNEGFVSAPELAQLSRELEVTSLLDTVSGSNEPPAVEAIAADPDRRIGQYVLVDELGAGGMGVVWKAWDTKLSRWVAIKQVKVQEPQLVRRFMQEAKLLAGLNHPNITRVYEVGIHSGKPFLVMELVDGGTPGDGKAMGRQQAAAVVRDAARAVHYAHEHGIVHRDLKPSNLLVSKSGRVFVTDFGLARMREEGNNLTQTGALLGTPAYMAPEQAQGKSADDRTDVYGLGATLFALVAGEAPYTGEIVHEIVKRVAISNAPSLEGNDDLVVVVQKAMERDREDRYRTAAELADDLDRFVLDEPIHARKVSSVERVWRRAKRNPLRAGAISASALVLASVMLWGGLFISDYLQRSAEISAASDALGRAESVALELKRMHGSGQLDIESEEAALAQLGAYVSEAQSAAPDYAETHYYAGMLHLWQGALVPAIESFTEALKDNPEHMEARARRAALELMVYADSPSVMQDIEGFKVLAPPATPALTAVLTRVEAELDKLPEDYSLRQLAQSILFNTRGNFEQAKDGLQAYLVDNPFDLTAKSMLLWPMLALGEYAAVEEHADVLIKRGRLPDLAHYLRALSFAGRGDTTSAITAMREAIRIEPDPASRNWVAYWLFSERKFEQAISEYNRVLEEDPVNLEALSNRSLLHAELGLLELATSDARRVTEIDPGNAYGFMLLADSEAHVQPDNAVKNYEHAASLDSAAAGEALFKAGDLRFVAGDIPAAIDLFQRSIAAEDSLMARYRLFDAHDSLGDSKAARDVLAGNTDDAYAQLLLSVNSYNNGIYDRSLSEIERAIELEPDDGFYRARKGRYLATFGESEAAVAEFEEAIQRSPDNTLVYREATQSWISVSEMERAHNMLQRWLEALPADTEAQQLKAELSP